MTTGIIGVPLGSYLSQRLNAKNVKADPYICATGLLLSAPLLVGAMFSVRANIYATYALIFFGELALNLNWAIVADILLVRDNHQFPSTLLCVFFFLFSLSHSLDPKAMCCALPHLCNY